MFGRKCPSCGEKIGREFNFCPICGHDLKSKKDGGLLDDIDENSSMFNEIKLPFGFNALFNRLTREIDKQLRDFDKVIGENKQSSEKQMMPRKIYRSNIIPLDKSGISISISSSSGKEPIIRVKTYGMPKGKSQDIEGFAKKAPKAEPVKLTKTQETKLATLPKQEPETKVRRLADKVIYEIALPGVKDKKDIIIQKLENSIEIKAFGKDKAFFKLIPVSLPIKKYDFRDGKLIIELKPEA